MSGSASFIAIDISRTVALHRDYNNKKDSEE